MINKIFNFIFPIGGGSVGATSSIFLNISWKGIDQLIFEAAILAIIGAVIGWGVKHTLDYLLKSVKKK